jgi:hypothetical protein
MKLHIHVQNIRETVEVQSADEALRRFKQETAKRAPMMLRPFINSMSDLNFAAEAVKRNNQASRRNDPAPTSTQQFLDWAVERGYVTVEQ